MKDNGKSRNQDSCFCPKITDFLPLCHLWLTPFFSGDVGKGCGWVEDRIGIFFSNPVYGLCYLLKMSAIRGNGWGWSFPLLNSNWLFSYFWSCLLDQGSKSIVYHLKYLFSLMSNQSPNTLFLQKQTTYSSLSHLPLNTCFYFLSGTFPHPHIFFN